MRIISLLPSATEIVALLLEHADGHEAEANVQLVGRSHECDFPANYLHLPKLTGAKTTFTTSADVDRQVREALAAGNGLYTVDKEKLKELKPDVILTQSLCSVCSLDYCIVSDIAKGMSPQPQIVDLNPSSLQDVLADVERIGTALGLPRAGAAAAAALRSRVQAACDAAAAAQQPGSARPSCAFIEWTEPLYPGGLWTPQLIAMAGASHPINPPLTEGGPAAPSTAVAHDKLVATTPDWLIIAPCGLDLATCRHEVASGMAAHPWWNKLPAVQRNQVVLVDGNQFFTRSGPRLVDALEFLVGLLAGRLELIPAGFAWERWA